MLVWTGATELLATGSQRGAVIVVLDDVHWADTASLQLLRHAIGATSPMDVTIICTYRDTDLNRLHPLGKLLADMHREANVTRIELGGLGDADLIEMLEVAAGSELDDAGIGLALALRRETDGNPFFTAELLRHLRESGGIVHGADGSLSLTGTLEELGLPNSVRDVIGRRVERLGPEPSRVLRLASVIGREFDLGLLARLADVDEDELLDVLEAGVDASLVVESAASDRFRFAHALIQHSLYDELRPARRQRAHQRRRAPRGVDAGDRRPGDARRAGAPLGGSDQASRPRPRPALRPPCRRCGSRISGTRRRCPVVPTGARSD